MLSLKEKFKFIDKQFLEKWFLLNFIKKIKTNYNIEDLIRLWIIAVIKKWYRYINLQIDKPINKYAIGACYMNRENYMYWGLNIYNRYNFTTQIAERYTIYNTQYAGKKIIHGERFIFKKVKESLLYGTTKKMINGHHIKYMSKERALIEAIRDGFFLQEEEIANIMPNIDKKNLKKLIKKYPIKSVVYTCKKLWLTK